MFEKFLNNGTNTFRQRYNETFGFWVDNVRKIRKLVKITYISDNNGHLVFVDDKGVESVLYSDSDEDVGFEFAPPVKSWYPHTTYGAVLGYRVPNQQYRRGIHVDNYSIVTLNSANNKVNLDVSFDNLNQMFNVSPKELSLTSFREFLSKKTSEMPLTYYINSQMVLYKNTASIFSVLIYDRPVATAKFLRSKDTLVLTEVNPLFMEECMSIGHLIKGIKLEVV
jgi:hypothetical protein